MERGFFDWQPWTPAERKETNKGLVQHGRQQHEKSKPLLEIRANYKSILIIITELTGQAIHCAVLIPLIVAEHIIGSVIFSLQLIAPVVQYLYPSSVTRLSSPGIKNDQSIHPVYSSATNHITSAPLFILAQLDFQSVLFVSTSSSASNGEPINSNKARPTTNG